MKTLVVLTAPPACGKSTWAKNYQKAHPHTYIVSSDDLRKEITGVTDDFSRQAEVWELFDKRITEYCMKEEETVTVIADSLCDLNSLRVDLVKKHPEFERFVLINFTCLYEESYENNKKRAPEYVVPDDQLKRLWNKFEKPDSATLEYFDDYVRIIGNFKN